MTSRWLPPTVLLMATMGGACASAQLAPTPLHPGLIIPTPSVPRTRPVEASEAAPTASSSAAPKPSVASSPAGGLPDPPPLVLAEQWEYELRFDGGKVSIASVRRIRLARPVATARRIGRYAIELWIGEELVDRVRFDFPGLAGEQPSADGPQSLREPPRFAAGAHVSRKVRVPASPRATRAILVDRATGRETPLKWPPIDVHVPAATPAASASATPFTTVPDGEPNE